MARFADETGDGRVETGTFVEAALGERLLCLWVALQVIKAIKKGKAIKKIIEITGGTRAININTSINRKINVRMETLLKK